MSNSSIDFTPFPHISNDWIDFAVEIFGGCGKGDGGHFLLHGLNQYMLIDVIDV